MRYILSWENDIMKIDLGVMRVVLRFFSYIGDLYGFVMVGDIAVWFFFYVIFLEKSFRNIYVGLFWFWYGK